MANPNLIVAKRVDLDYAAIGDVLNYTVTIKNTGDTSANNVNLIDLIPQGANFVEGSILINNNAVNNGINPALGISIGTIAQGQTTTVTFQGLVVNIPPQNPMSNLAQIDYQYNFSLTSIANGSIDTNSVVTTINNPNVSLTKTLNRSIVSINDVITYTVNIKNTGTVAANNVTFIDTIPSGTSLVANSVNIGGVTLAGFSPAPPGINVGTLPVNTQTNLVFRVTVVSIPAGNLIKNTCHSTFSFLVNPTTNRRISSGQSSNTVVSSNTRVATLSSITQYVSKSFASCNEILKYTTVLFNGGNVDAYNIKFKSTIPNGTAFITNSVYIDNLLMIGASPTSPTGVSVPTISSGSISTISYQVQIKCT